MSDIPVWAPVASSLISAVALVFGVVQLRVNERTRQRNNSDALWRQYELLCIEHPDFAFPDETKLDFEKESGKFGGCQQKFTSYEYFVSFLLYACEGIVTVYRTHSDWHESVMDELHWHKKYLTSEYFKKYLPTCSQRIRSLIALL